jgi:hypothetical protein
MTPEEMRKYTDEQLEAVLNSGTYSAGLAAWELQRRQLESMKTALKPTHHWTATPAFWVALIAMVFAAIAAWPVIREWISWVAAALARSHM